MICLIHFSNELHCLLGLHAKLIVMSLFIPHGGVFSFLMAMLCLQVYDVLKPNKRFRKGSPDDPRLVVCLATGPVVPSFRVIQHLQQRLSPLPLQFARVAGGEVSFHSVQNST